MGAFKQMQLEEIENEQQSVAQHQAAHQQFLHRMSQGRAPLRMHTAASNPYQQELVENSQPSEDELKEGVMAASISELKDMWLVRFGDTWVSEDTLQDDRFWVLASARLKATRNLEAHSLFNQFKVVYRIIQ